MYEFMADAYHGNWQYRWAQTPYLKKQIATGKNEPISGHQWACIGFWFYLRRVCPSLDELVDPVEVYERLWSHDLGETFQGDVSQFRQLKGEGSHKHIIERKEIVKMGRKMPKKMLNQLLQWFDEFEDDYNKMDKLEVLTAKFIDTLQGDHFAMVFGKDLREHSEVISKIVNRTFISVTLRFLKVLKSQGHKKAYNEVKAVANNHIKNIRQAGVKLNLAQQF